MKMVSRWALTALGMALALALPAHAQKAPRDVRWVGAWASAQMAPAEKERLAPADYSDATLRQLQHALERNKVVTIAPAAGTKFDPHHHQAISMVPADQEANTVVSVLQKGYLIADRVLRPALVTVAAPK